jgi:hypothetical protein
MGQYERAISPAHSQQHDPGGDRPSKRAQMNMVARAGFSVVKTGYMMAGFPETDTVFDETDMVGLPKRANGARKRPGFVYRIREGVPPLVVGGLVLTPRSGSRFRNPPGPARYDTIIQIWTPIAASESAMIKQQNIMNPTNCITSFLLQCNNRIPGPINMAISEIFFSVIAGFSGSGAPAHPVLSSEPCNDLTVVLHVSRVGPG